MDQKRYDRHNKNNQDGLYVAVLIRKIAQKHSYQ